MDDKGLDSPDRSFTDDDVLPLSEEETELGSEESIESVEDEPLEEDHKFSSSINDVIKSSIVVAGRDLYIYDFVKKGAKLTSLNPQEIKKVEEVYAAPSIYKDIYSKLVKNRLLVLVGEPHTSKHSTSIKLAHDLEEFNIREVWTLRFSENASLADFLEDENCPKNCIFILHDAFIVPGINFLEIQRHHSQILLLLQNKNNYVILTSDTNQLSLDDELPESALFELAELYTEHMLNILEKHIRFYNLPSEKSLNQSQKKKIISSLRNPYEIDRLCQKINADSVEFSEKRLTLLIEMVTNTEAEAQRWFSELNLNQKYYALLVGLLPNIDNDKLFDIYERIVIVLQSKNVHLESPLNFSMEELQIATDTVARLKSVEFQTYTYKQYVLNQITNAYKQQFKFLIPTFSNLTLEFSASKSPDFIDTRIILASAIGEIGKSSWEDIIPILFKWAKDNSAVIRTCVAHALRSNATQKSQLPIIFNLLMRWQHNKNPRLRWTVAASLERLYPYYGDTALELLSELASDSNDHVTRAVAHAFSGIARRDLDIVIGWIIDRLVQSDNIIVRKTAINSFVRILNENKQFREYIKGTNTKLFILPLMKEMLCLGEPSLSIGMKLLKSWLKNSDDEIANEIESIILETCEYSSKAIRDDILTLLVNNWAKPTDRIVYEFAVVTIDLINRIPDIEREEGLHYTGVLRGLEKFGETTIDFDEIMEESLIEPHRDDKMEEELPSGTILKGKLLNRKRKSS